MSEQSAAIENIFVTCNLALMTLLHYCGTCLEFGSYMNDWIRELFSSVNFQIIIVMRGLDDDEWRVESQSISETCRINSSPSLSTHLPRHYLQWRWSLLFVCARVRNADEHGSLCGSDRSFSARTRWEVRSGTLRFISLSKKKLRSIQKVSTRTICTK